jgi:protein TonB
MVTDLIAATQTETKRMPQQALRATQVAPDLRIARATVRVIPITPARRNNNLFSEALLEMSSTRSPRRTGDLFISILFHSFVLLVLLLPPLYFTDTIDLKGFAQTFLVAPPPPPPPAPMAQTVTKAETPRRVFTSGGKLLAPSAIPQRVVILKEDPLPPDITSGVAGGVLGGVPGGQMGGVLGGIISGASRTYVPAPTPASSEPRAPIRVGGRVRPPLQLVRSVPDYPILARQSKIEGTVLIDAVIDTEGNVVEMRVLSGPLLLLNAALAAVREWKYQPTYLNDRAIAVQLTVTVTFKLDR